ncbi:calcium incorporation protein MxaA, partial [Verminephrobacter eiseniae]|nr:calcium incorporation protein MxaA [Verminephrobacter eiseniae]
MAVMLPCPARAQTNGSGATGTTGGVRVGGPIVQPPRAFGYQLGDLVTQRLLLPADGRRLETAALPRAERISGWLERRPFQWETDAEGRQWLLVSYQIVNAPQTLTAIALPALSLPMSAGPALETDAQLISVGPLTPQTVLGKGGLLDIRPDRPASASSHRCRRRAIGALGATLAGTLA